MKKTIGLLIGLGLVSSLAQSQNKPDPLEACYQQPDGAPRLACFNREMQRRHAAAAAPATANSAATTPANGAPATAAPGPAPAHTVTASKVADDTGLQGSALRRKLKAEGRTPAVVQPIVARIVRMVPRPHAVQAYVLDNGQTWEAVETLDNLDIKLQDTVTIKPGLLGSFFLSTPRNQTIRVHRIL